MKQHAALAALAVVAITAACPPGDGGGEVEGKSEGEGEGGEGEGEAFVRFTCADPNPAVGQAIGPGAGWDLVDVVEGDAGLDVLDRIAVDDDGRAVGFDALQGLLVELGTFPALAVSAVTLDPILPQHRAGFPVFNARSLVFDDGDLVFSYAIGVGGLVEGAVFVESLGAPILASNPFSARWLDDRLLVSAGGLLGQGSTENGAPVQGFFIARDDPATAAPLLTVDGGDSLRFDFAGDDVVVTRFDDGYSIHAFDRQALLTTTTPLAVPAQAPGNAIAQAVVDAFDVDGGVVLLDGFGGGLAEGVVFVDEFSGFDADAYGEDVVDFDDACTEVVFAFAVDGDPVVVSRDLDAFVLQMLRLRRR
jgi:hypothetical protein